MVVLQGLLVVLGVAAEIAYRRSAPTWVVVLVLVIGAVAGLVLGVQWLRRWSRENPDGSRRYPPR